MNRLTYLATLVALLLTACDIELPDDLVRPPDEYCFPGKCAASEFCNPDDGLCYAPCEKHADCVSGCCMQLHGTPDTYCGPQSECWP